VSLRRTTLLLAASALFAGAVSTIAPTASAVDRHEVSFSVTFFFPGPSTVEPTITQLGDSVVRVEDVAYFGVGSPELGDEAGATLTWLVNLEEMRGTVSGIVTMHHPVLDLLWEGDLRGHVTPAGVEGVLHLTEVSSGQRFSGRWTSLSFVDPTANPHTLVIVVTGTVTSA
jgi:hypothetical protein